MKPLKVVVLLISALALSACGIKNRSSNNDLPSANVPDTSVPTEHSAVNGAIGPSGGEIKDPDNNLTISIPQGALQEDTYISAQYIEEPSYLEANPSMNFLGAVEFGPSGTTFDKPVEVSLQLTDTPKNNKISIFCYSEEYDIWDYITDASVNNNIATFNISHFSKYKALDISMEMLMKFNDLVRQAQATGQSDSWIHENFKNYLINEEHVMDIYSYFGGYWYEPCGLIIGGNYHINGKEGDPNELTELIGETNKVGNTYGLCHDGQLIVDSKTYKKIVGKPKEGQETISVNVGVYYKMIKPDIDLTASKKKLNKGESATISIRCHYTNARNFYPEFKDLEMSNYMLTIAKPSHFDIDKSAVLTDDEGLASFVVTAKENDQAETITVNFDVSGDFGTHAEGNITLNSTGGYQLIGHIEQQFSVFYSYTTEDAIKVSDGSATVTIEYDFNASLAQAEIGLAGSIKFSNVTSAISGSVPYEAYSVQEDGTIFRSRFNLFSEIARNRDNSASYPITGSVSDNECTVGLGPDAQPYSPEIGPYSAEIGFKTKTEFINGNQHSETSSNLSLYLILTSTPLLPFSINEKTPQTTMVYSMKDSLEILEIYLNELSEYHSVSGMTTTQTITVA